MSPTIANHEEALMATTTAARLDPDAVRDLHARNDAEQLLDQFLIEVVASDEDGDPIVHVYPDEGMQPRIVELVALGLVEEQRRRGEA